jgi:hypothetical protein
VASNTNSGLVSSGGNPALVGTAVVDRDLMSRCGGGARWGLGLRLGIVAALGCWSLAGIATGFVGSFRGLVGCRMVLGAAEAAGIPASSKSVAIRGSLTSADV